MEGIKKILNSKNKTFTVFCFCFLVGVGFISVIDFEIDFVYIYLSLFISISILIIFWQNKTVRFFVICFLFFTIGVGRYLVSIPSDNQNNIIHYTGEKKIVIGYVSAEPDIRMDSARYIVDGLQTTDHSQDYGGKIYLKYLLYPRYEYGDKLEIECNLEAPEPIEDFRYDKYLARFGVHTLCQNPKITKIGSEGGSKILASIYDMKTVVADKINKLWHEPKASFMAGLLYGYRGGLGELNELFNRTGVTHIVAISGYNITIIATILISICLGLYIPRKKAFWVISLGIVVFVIFAGLSASVVRAGVMGVIVLLSRQTGRVSQVGTVMLLTAVLMTLHNPYILMWDAGFQLSFISTLGLVYLAAKIRKPFDKIPEYFGIKESLISTLAAIIATLPLILFQFGRLSIVAPIVNVLILWIIPWIMMLGFFAVLLSFVFNPLALVVSWLAGIMMSYIIVTVRWFASLKFAAVDLYFPLWGMVFGYLMLFLWINGNFSKKIKNKLSL